MAALEHVSGAELAEQQARADAAAAELLGEAVHGGNAAPASQGGGEKKKKNKKAKR